MNPKSADKQFPKRHAAKRALRHVLEPIFETEFAGQSYGFRPGRGAKDALRRVDTLLKAGHVWVVDADLKSYFDTIPHARLLALVRARVADGRVLALVESFLRAGVLEESKGWKPTDCGTPQGGVIRPLLANLYLDPLDHQMAVAGWEMVRYADDFVILCRTEAEAHAALAAVRAWVAEAGLTLHPEKTRVVDATQRGGFDFLGYHFERGMRWPRAKSLQKLKERVRAKTLRTDGRSLRAIVADVNRTGMATSSTARATCLRRWMATGGDDCGVCWKSGVAAPGKGWGRRSNAGRTSGLPAVGCCPWQRNTSGRGPS